MIHLTREQRYVISALFKREIKSSEIARKLGVHKSTIGRELKRNCTNLGRYSAPKAHVLAIERKEIFGIKRRFIKIIEKQVSDYITKKQWSPDQILRFCKRHDITMVSVERIYQFIR